MTTPPKDSIPNLLVSNIPRELILAIEEGLEAGAKRAYASAKGMNDGHMPHVVGQLRHFHMNETFQLALEVAAAMPTPIRGNSIVTGRSGMFTLARFNTSQSVWNNARRSNTRRQMAMANKAIEPLVQPGLFEQYVRPSNATVFFVACFSASLKVQPEAPISIQIAVPDGDMEGWLFKESLDVFKARYDLQPATQLDQAIPKLKQNVIKKMPNVDGGSS